MKNRAFKIGKWEVSWKFLLLVAFVLFLAYMRYQSNIETPAPSSVLDVLGLR